MLLTMMKINAWLLTDLVQGMSSGIVGADCECFFSAQSYFCHWKHLLSTKKLQKQSYVVHKVSEQLDDMYGKRGSFCKRDVSQFRK